MIASRHAALRQECTERPAGSSCIVCGEEDGRVLYRKHGYPIHRCTTCGLGSTLVPSDWSATSIYDAAYFQGGRRHGYADYVGSQPALRRQWQRVLDLVSSYAPEGSRLLEVGCAYGYFLQEAREKFDCTGIELSAEAAADARLRGLEILTGPVSRELLDGLEPFKVILMLDVIEHLPNPAETLTLLHDVLEHDGILVITTGDWQSLLARVLGRWWRLVTPPEHLYLFSADNLHRLLDKCGFRPQRTTRPTKIVPLGLVLHQAASWLRLRLPRWRRLHALGVPLNLFDALRVVAVKQGSPVGADSGSRR